ncbi:MAG TPA: MFS transporter [Candidatus Sulfotelmatobacter sp.]|nr:MFS transporter [Candidatus Sulfotelmatobacter sp.]
MDTPADPRLESATINRLMWRLMPFLFLLYIVAYLDRINVGFAVLQMSEPLHLTDRVKGVAFGMFFAGYFFFQVPSNLVLQKVGVRRWISGLMVTWGVVSCSMIFIRGPRSFYVLRFLLGAAEAGFFPGMILYLKHWFPARARARAVAWFMTANPLAGVVGSPISGALLGLHGSGLAGWQWLFLMEGAPAILLGVAVLWVLAESPKQARWLRDDERKWLLDQLNREEQAESGHAGGLWSVFVDWRVWVLSLVYFGLPAAMYGVTAWLPTAIHSMSGLSNQMIGVVAAIPYFATAIAMVVVGRHSDRTGERAWHTAAMAFLGAGALGVAAYGGASFLVIAGMSVGMLGAQSMAGPFWAMATSRMKGTAAAASIAIINSVANLGGYFGPYIIGFVRSDNRGFGGLLAIAVVLAVSGCLALVVGAEQAPSLAAKG